MVMAETDEGNEIGGVPRRVEIFWEQDLYW